VNLTLTDTLPLPTAALQGNTVLVRRQLGRSPSSPQRSGLMHQRALPDTVASTRLTTFCTRPGILCLPLNLLTEAISTFVFVFLVLMMWDQARAIGAGEAARLYSLALFPILIGVVIGLMMLSLGGPTAFSGECCLSAGCAGLRA
jgi:glycerol uptake facilitator-like aquaporin